MKTDALLIRLHGNIRKQSVLVSLLSVILAYTPAGMALKFKELSDDQLANMRGRYVAPETGRVQYFGLTMNTSWKTPAFSHQVETKVFVDASKKTVKAFMSKAGTLGEKAKNAATAKHNTALEKINGSVQSIQLVGDGNTVRNNISLNVGSGDKVAKSYADAIKNQPITRAEVLGLPAEVVVQPVQEAEPIQQARPIQQAQPIQAQPAQQVATVSKAPAAPKAPVTSLEESFQNKNNVTTHFNQNGSIGYTVVSGNNVIAQQLKRGAAHQILQSVMLHGSAHQVINNMKLDVSFMRNNSLRQPRIRSHRSWFGLK